MTDDRRKNHILNTVASFFSKDPNELKQRHVDDRHLNKFLDDLNVPALIITGGKEISMTTKLETLGAGGAGGRSLVFFKAKQDAITDDNYKTSILVSSIVDSPMQSLLYLLQNLYSPAIQQASRSSTDVYEAKLTNNLADLETSLKMSIRRVDTDSSASSKKSSVSPLDEFQYWAEERERGKSKEQKERASFFYGEFKPLIDSYKKIDSCPLPEILEIIETTQDSYDYIWQQTEYEPQYSQDRMTNLLEITGMTILKSLLNKLLKINPFEDSFGDVKELLKHALAVCDRWIECCHNLYRMWKSCPTHRWESEEYSPTSIKKYRKRVNEVLQIRSAREQYAMLVKTVPGGGAEDGEDAKGKKSYRVFDGLEPLQYNPYTESKWQEALQAYDRSMDYMDQKTAQILKAHLRQAQSNPRQLLAEFLRYSDLIRRERVKNELTSERQAFLNLKKYPKFCLNILKFVEKF